MAKTFNDTAGNDVLNYTLSSAKIQALGGNDIIGSYGNNVTIDGGAGDDNIFNYGGYKVSINGGAGNDIIGTVMNRKDASSGKKVTIAGGTGNDYITSATDRGNLFKYNSGDGFDTIEGFNSNDTLQITDSSYSTMFSGNDFVVFVGNGAILLKNSANLSVKIKDSAGKLTTYNKNPTNALGGTDYADIIVNTNKNAAVLGFGGNDSITNYADGVFISGDDGNDEIRNLSDKVSINAGAGDDYIESHGDNGVIGGLAGNDTIYVEGTGNFIDGGAGYNVILSDTSNGGNVIGYGNGNDDDLVYGFHANDTIETTATTWSTQTSGNNVIVNIGRGSITLVDAKGINPNIVYTPSELSASPVTLGAAVKIANASKRGKAIKITGNALDNSITGSSKNDSLYGGAGNDLIFGNAGNDKLYGQAGNDTLSGDTGNDTLTGGAGNDLFIYTAGKDVITDYASGDKISLGAAISKATLNGSDAVLTVGKGTLTVKDAKQLTLIDSTGKEFTTVFGGLTLDNTAGATTLPSGIATADASARTKAIKITGNALANMISGGAGNDKLYGGKGNDSLVGNKGNDNLYGQNGDDTLWGGVGNDTLTGGAGADTFIYASGEGKDVIADFGDDDLLQITGTFSGTYNKSKNTIAFKVGSTANALTLKDFTATTFNINGDAYRISGNKLMRSA